MIRAKGSLSSSGGMHVSADTRPQALLDEPQDMFERLLRAIWYRIVLAWRQYIR